MIITSGSLLRAGAGAVRCLRSAIAGVVVAEIGRSEGGSRTVERRFGYRRKAEGREPRAGGALERTRSRGIGAWGKPQAERQREQFFAFWVFMLGFVELGP